MRYVFYLLCVTFIFPSPIWGGNSQLNCRREVHIVSATKYHSECGHRNCRTKRWTTSGTDARKPGVAIARNAPKWLSRAKSVRYRYKGRWSSWLKVDDNGPGSPKGNGNWIDVRCGSHSESERWGRKQVRVEVR